MACRPPDVLPGSGRPEGPRAKRQRQEHWSCPQHGHPADLAVTDALGYDAPDPITDNHANIAGHFTGDYHGVSWNAQGYFMARTSGQARKKLAVSRMLASRDFVLISEAHATAGGIQTYVDIHEGPGLGRHDNQRMGGVLGLHARP